MKRRYVSKVDWSRAVATAMASRRDLKTQAALTKKSGVAQLTIGRILRGEVNPQSGNLEQIARAFSMSIGGLAEIGQDGESVAELIDDIKSVERSEYVVLISWAQAASFVDASDSPRPGDDDEWMPRPKRSGPRTFALRVRASPWSPDTNTVTLYL